MKIGAMELIVIFIIALLVIGPDKLPTYARKFGNALREFRKASSDITQDIRESVVDPLEEAQRPLRDAMEPLEELNRDVRANIKGVENDLKNIGKEKAKKPAEGDETKETAAAPEQSILTETPTEANENIPDAAPEASTDAGEETETGGSP